MEKKLFLLDAYALIFRAYYAFISRPIRNSKGLNTSAVFGFVNTLDEVLRKEQPSHIAVAFDPPSPTFRHDMFDAYKANREETPPDIKLAVPYIKEILDAYRIPILEVDGFEADDVIGTMAKKAKNQGFTVYMMTPDKDYAQLVEEGIFMFKPRRSGDDAETWGPEEIKEKFGVERPEQVIDILALWGDSSDNIPGAPGIGEKTAKKLIGQYGSVENLFQHIDDLKGKQKENLSSHIDQVKLSKELVTIDVDVPVNIPVEDLVRGELNTEKLQSLFNELEFRTLSKRILGSEGLTAKEETQGTLFDVPVETTNSDEQTSFKSFDPGQVNYHLVTTEDKLEKLIDKIQSSKIICFDTETTGLDVLEADLLGVSFAVNPGEAWYVSSFQSDEHIKETLNKLFQNINNKDVIKVGHNIKYDLEILRKYDVDVKGPYFDTMIAHYLLKPEGKHKLDNLTENLLGYKMISIEELIGKKGKDQRNMRDIKAETVSDYACEDADLTLQLYHHLEPELRKGDLSQLANDIDFPLIEVLTDMELKGFNLNTGTLGAYEKSLEKEINDIGKKIYEQAGEEFNIASPKQLGIILFEKLKIAANTKMTKTKQYSTSEEVLQRLRDSHPIVDLILDYRSVTKLYSTYVTALPRLINPKTKRIHSSFNQTIAATGRLSSVNPNLQNIPIRDERGREIRKSFIPASDDFTLFAADYSQIELRLMAHMSEDEHLLDAFNHGADIHRSTAAKIYKTKPEEVTREMRSKAKTANFGIIYGISAFGLSQRLNIPRTEAKDLIDNYFQNFPGVKSYMDECIELAKKQGYVTTLYGRKRYLPDINSGNSVVRGVAQRNAINSPIQGSAADIIKIAMINIFRKLKGKYKSSMILQVHDELVFDVYKPEFDEIKELVTHEMEHAAKLKVPLLVESGSGDNWLEAH